MQIKHLCLNPHLNLGWSWRRETGLSRPVKYFYWPFQRWYLFVDHLCYLCLMFVMLSRLFIAALWSPGKGLTSWLLFVMFNFTFVPFPCGILGQVWYLIVSIPDLWSPFLLCWFILRASKRIISLYWGLWKINFRIITFSCCVEVLVSKWLF